jgi:hypothetical protein
MGALGQTWGSIATVLYPRGGIQYLGHAEGHGDRMFEVNPKAPAATWVLGF